MAEQVAAVGCERTELSVGWQLAWTEAGRIAGGGRDDGAALDALNWVDAIVPGTVASVFGESAGAEIDARDWWYRVRFDGASLAPGPEEQCALVLNGIATIYEVFLNGIPICRGSSMFERSEVVLDGLGAGVNDLLICVRALAPELSVRRRPRARWRTALVSEPNLRFFRTMLLGRAPGFAPGPPVAGIWAPVELVRRRRVAAEALNVNAAVRADGSGVLTAQVTGWALDGVPPESLVFELTAEDGAVVAAATVVVGEVVVAGAGVEDPAATTDRSRTADGLTFAASAELRVLDVERWWPHTHGAPTRYTLSVRAGQGDGEIELARRKVGFRELRWPADWESSGLALTVNGVDVFARGAVWTPLDLTAPWSRGPALREALATVVDGGMNMLRVPGIGCYESDEFYDLCDELGIMVWQDFMLANFDYPAGDERFDDEFEREVRQFLARTASRPSLTVLCGGSEVAQQLTMQGRDPSLARGPLYAETLPRLIAESGAAAVYVPNAPWGDGLPFRTDTGVANYYGVGAYLRDLSDARLAEVKFAAECLAFANVPEPATLERIEAPGGLVVHHPAWKAAVPRDAGAGWDFDDVRDHYLERLFGCDAARLRWAEHDRYLELSRAVSGEVMAASFGEWRRVGSRCAGALVLWLRDLVPGAGWGLLDERGGAKVAYHYLRRALAPVAVWLTDEGLGGTMAHVANDRPVECSAQLRVGVYRGGEVMVEQAVSELRLEPHSGESLNLEDLIGHFVDLSYAYRFGPPGHDLVVASLERDDELISQAFQFPLGLPTDRQPVAEAGVELTVIGERSRPQAVQIASRRLLYGVRLEVEGLEPADNFFSVEPSHPRTVALRPAVGAVCGEAVGGRGGERSGAVDPRISLSALNLTGRVQA